MGKEPKINILELNEDDPIARALQKVLGKHKDHKIPPKEEQLELIDKHIESKTQTDFKVGDLITPRHGTRLRWHGRPFKVIEVFDKPKRVETEPNHPGCMSPLHLRAVGVMVDGNLCEFAWNKENVEAWYPEMDEVPETGPLSDRNAPDDLNKFQ